jgi:hypothetical protein
MEQKSLGETELQEGGEDYACPWTAVRSVVFTKYCCGIYRWRIEWAEHLNTHSEMSNARTVLVVLKLKDVNWT